MTRYEEIKSLIAAARNYDDTNAIEDLDEMNVLYSGDAVTDDERKELDKLLCEREERISHAIQIAAIACSAAERARGGLYMDHKDIWQAAYEICLDDVESF